MKLLIGLGNIGKEYDNTRHNIGFAALDFVYENWLRGEGFSEWSENKKFQALVSTGTLNGEKVILAKPTTFMNNSGIATQLLAAYYKIEPQNIIVLHDDVDLPFGTVKIQANRGSAGHNGIKSIIEKLGTQDFTRVRIGVAKADKRKQGDTGDFVLNRFNILEKLQLKKIKAAALVEVRKLLSGGKI